MIAASLLHTKNNMDKKTFTKKDENFVCDICGSNVDQLGYSSRDHCNVCLASKHVDNNPGDRSNPCHGKLLPCGIKTTNKGYVINYQCNKCGKFHNNKAAKDDSFDAILAVSNGTYEQYLQKLNADARFNKPTKS